MSKTTTSTNVKTKLETVKSEASHFAAALYATAKVLGLLGGGAYLIVLAFLQNNMILGIIGAIVAGFGLVALVSTAYLATSKLK